MISYKFILAYFNKFHEETYQKNLYENLKIDYLNDKTVIITYYVKKFKNKNSEKKKKKKFQKKIM